MRSRSKKRVNSGANKHLSLEEYKTFLTDQLPIIAKERFRKAAQLAIKEVAENVLERSYDMVPLDDGDLLASGRVGEIEESGNGYKIKVSYGDGMTNYAFFLHENMAYNSGRGQGPADYGASGKAKIYSNNTGERGPKYLERAMNEKANSDEVIKVLKKYLSE